MKHAQTGDPRYVIADEAERALYWEDLLGFRRRGGLPGHAEMEGKTLFFKFNTGPSGHGSPPAAGEALALKRAGAAGVRVFAFEGEGGLTTGASHETKNSAWGLGLDNLVYVVDWNDFGIDDHPVSSVVHGTPEDWFRPYGWRVLGTEHGSDFAHVHPLLVEAVHGENPGVPTVVWVKTRKGRGYLKYDDKSHGSPHSPPNCELYWETKRPFAEKYGVDFEGFGQPAPKDPAEFRKQVGTNLRKVAEVLHRDQELVDYLAATLGTRIGDSVPAEIPGYRLNARRHPDRGSEADRLPLLSRVDLGEAGREAAEPRGAGQVGRLGEHALPEGVRTPSLPRHVGRPRGIDEHRRLRRRMGRDPRMGLVRPHARTRRGRSCRRRSPSSRTPGVTPGSHR